MDGRKGCIIADAICGVADRVCHDDDRSDDKDEK